MSLNFDAAIREANYTLGNVADALNNLIRSLQTHSEPSLKKLEKLLHSLNKVINEIQGCDGLLTQEVRPAFRSFHDASKSLEEVCTLTRTIIKSATFSIFVGMVGTAMVGTALACVYGNSEKISLIMMLNTFLFVAGSTGLASMNSDLILSSGEYFYGISPFAKLVNCAHTFYKRCDKLEKEVEELKSSLKNIGTNCQNRLNDVERTAANALEIGSNSKNRLDALNRNSVKTSIFRSTPELGSQHLFAAARGHSGSPMPPENWPTEMHAGDYRLLPANEF